MDKVEIKNFSGHGKILETERLILRAWEINDVDDFFEFEKIQEITIMAGRKPVESREEAIDRLNFYINDKNKERFAIVLKETGSVIGNITIAPDKNRGRFFAKLLSYSLSKNYWNKRYMTEAVKRVMKYTFDELKVDLLTVFHYPHNVQSKRVIEKCGFIYETTIKDSQIIYDGNTYDAVVYSLFKEDWDRSKVIESRCGLLCSECGFKESCGCGGCIETNGHPYHGECPVAKCCQDKGFMHCGECSDIPEKCSENDCKKVDETGFHLCDGCEKTTCGKLHAYSYTDPVHGDNPAGARIERCKNWCKQ